MGNSWCIVNIARAERIDPGDFGLQYRHSPTDCGGVLWGRDSWATRALEWLLLTGRWQGRDVCFASEQGGLEWADETRAAEPDVRDLDFEDLDLRFGRAFRDIACETRDAMATEPISVPGRITMTCVPGGVTLETFDRRGRSMFVRREGPVEYADLPAIGVCGWSLVPRIDHLIDTAMFMNSSCIVADLEDLQARAHSSAHLDVPAKVVLECSTDGWEWRVYAASSALLGRQFGIAEDPDLGELVAQLVDFPELVLTLARTVKQPSPRDVVEHLRGAVSLLDPP